MLRGTQVKRCNEMSRRLRFFHEQVTGAEIPMAGALADIGTDLDELEVRSLVAVTVFMDSCVGVSVPRRLQFT